MRVVILLSDPGHPIAAKLHAWAERTRRAGHYVSVLNQVSELPPAGDLLFLVSFGEILPAGAAARFRHALVLHASDLPRGRGWSPHVWQVLAGSSEVTVSLISAAEKVDRGDIWKKERVDLVGHELFDEINELVFEAEMRLMDYAMSGLDDARRVAQDTTGIEPTYHPRRKPEDSRLDPNASIIEQFDLLRVCDPDRFPAFFEHRDTTYGVRLWKLAEGLEHES